jgi:hypothetical protein
MGDDAMSERGSFVTEYIYCSDCHAAARKVLLRDTVGAERKAFDSSELPAWTGGFHPIIAGKLGASFVGGELQDFEHYDVPVLAAAICHPLRVAVLAEEGEQIFTIQPTTKGKKP